jgi:hypothetical protein
MRVPGETRCIILGCIAAEIIQEQKGVKKARIPGASKGAMQMDARAFKGRFAVDHEFDFSYL